MVASRSKTSKQNLTVEVATAVSEAVSSVSSVGPVSETVSSVVVGVSLSLPLGNMDGSGGVGDVASGTSVGSSDSRDGGRGNAEGGEGGRGGDLGVAGDHRGDSVDGVGDNRGMGVAHDRGNSVMSRVDTVVGLSLSLPLAVVESVAVSETVGPVATVVATKAVSVSVVGISLRLSLPLAIVESMAVSKTVSPVATVVATKTVAVAVVGIGISLRLSSGEGRKGKCQDLRVKKLLGGEIVNRERQTYSLHLSSATFCDKPCSSQSPLLFYTQATTPPPLHQRLLSHQAGENVNALRPANLVLRKCTQTQKMSDEHHHCTFDIYSPDSIQ